MEPSGISRGGVAEAIGDKTVGKLMEGQGKKQGWGEKDQLGNKLVHGFLSIDGKRTGVLSTPGPVNTSRGVALRFSGWRHD